MIPRHQIVTDPTPLVAAPRISERLGIELFIKRDDLAGPSFGGNKSRQLEYYFGAALAEKADTILITGAVQSNFVRLAAAVARGLGLHPIVQLEERVPRHDRTYARSGNVLLEHLLGAEILHYPVGEDEAGADLALFEKAAELRHAGRAPFVIPLGEDHPPLGALGYVNAAQEILQQDDRFEVIVVASGSGATHTGLLAGLRGAGSKAKVIGSCVRRDANAQTARIRRLLTRLEAIYPQAAKTTAKDVILWDGALSPGYGKLGPHAMDAMKLLGREEGLVLDPVYTAKAFAAIPALVASGKIPKGCRVCFVHTGGLAALFAYQDDILSLL